MPSRPLRVVAADIVLYGLYFTTTTIVPSLHRAVTTAGRRAHQAIGRIDTWVQNRLDSPVPAPELAEVDESKLAAAAAVYADAHTAETVAKKAKRGAKAVLDTAPRTRELVVDTPPSTDPVTGLTRVDTFKIIRDRAGILRVPIRIDSRCHIPVLGAPTPAVSDEN